MGATFGHNLRMTIFGESHGNGIGLVLDGLPPGTPIDEDFIKEEMARRAPGKNQTFQRLQPPERCDAARTCGLRRKGPL